MSSARLYTLSASNHVDAISINAEFQSSSASFDWSHAASNASSLHSSSSSSFDTKPQFFEGTQLPSHDETLFFHHKTVEWSAPRYSVSDRTFRSKRLKAFTSPDSFKQVLRARLASSSASAMPSFDAATNPMLTAQATVLLHSDYLSVYADSGEVRSVSLPCRMRRVHALSFGLLLERACEPGEDNGLPVLFSLMSCLEEIKPVSVVRALAAQSDSHSDSDFFLDAAEQIVHCDSTQPLIVTYHTAALEHRVYVLRQSRVEEAKRQRFAVFRSEKEERVRQEDEDEEAQHEHAAPSGGFIRCEFLLQLGFTLQSTPEAAHRVFLAADAEKCPLLCLMFKHSQTLIACSIERDSSDCLVFKRSFTLHALDALPLHVPGSQASGCFDQAHDDVRTDASDDEEIALSLPLLDNSFERDILVFTPQRRLALYSGNHHLVDIHLISDQLFLASPIESIDDPVKQRWSIRDAAGCMHRAFLNPECITPLAHACFHLCQLVLREDVDLCVNLRRDWLRIVQESGVDPDEESEADREWRNLCSLLLDLLGSTTSARDQFHGDGAEAMKLNASALAQAEPLSYSKLSASPSSYSHASSQSAIGSDSRHTRSSASFAADIALPSSREQDPMNFMSKSQSESKRQKRQRANRPAFLVEVARFQRFAGKILLALHLLYEELKCHVRTNALHSRALAFFLFDFCAMVGRLDWCEAYQRDWPELSESLDSRISSLTPSLTPSSLFRRVDLPANDLARAACLPTAHPHLASPPCLLEWVRLSLILPANAELVDYPLMPLVFHSNHPYQTSRCVCELYDTMRRRSSEVSQYAELSRLALQSPPSSDLFTSAESSSSSSTASSVHVSACASFHSWSSPYPETSFPAVTPAHNASLSSQGARLSSARARSMTPFEVHEEPLPVEVNTHHSHGDRFALFTPGRPQYRSTRRSPSSSQQHPSSVTSLSYFDPPPSPAASTVLPSFQAHLIEMIASYFSLQSLAELPLGLSFPLYEALRIARFAPDVDAHLFSNRALILIGRPDLAAMALQRSRVMAAHENGLELEPIVLEKTKAELAFTSSASASSSSSSALASDEDDADGMLLVMARASMRFGSDLRLKEVRHLLSSNRLCSLSLSQEKLKEIEASQGATDQAREWQLRLLVLMRRTLALSLGRGAFTWSSISASEFTHLPLPKLVQAARVHPSLTVVQLEPFPSLDPLEWPHFHNGVAAGLRIRRSRQMEDVFVSSSIETSSSSASNSSSAPSGSFTSSGRTLRGPRAQFARPPYRQQDAGNVAMHRTWILYNRPAALNHAHAGLLFALGLQGHLACLAPTDLYAYLQHHHDATTLAILLGMAASFRGTQDLLTSKMLCLHVPAFLPPSLDIGLSFLVRAGSFVGLGLLYEGSAHRLMTEVLLGELLKKGSDKGNERESYSLCAGIGLGLVLLGKGGDTLGVADLKIEDKLLALIHGGNNLDSEIDRSLQDLSSTSSSSANVSASVSTASTISNSSSQHIGQGINKHDTKAGHIDEGSSINIDLTAPGAMMALAFMYMKSNASHVASRLLPPSSHKQLERCRPDHLLLRTTARLLIAWDSIRPSHEFVLDQIPSFLSQTVQSMNEYVPWVSASVAGAPLASANNVALRQQDSENSDVDDDSDDETDGMEVDSNETTGSSSKSNANRENNPRTAERTRMQRLLDMISFNLRSDDEENDPLSSKDAMHEVAAASPLGPFAKAIAADATDPVIAASSRAVNGRQSGRSPLKKSAISSAVPPCTPFAANAQSEVDYESSRIAYCGIVAGSCLALGLRFAGTCHGEAASVLSYFVRCFRAIRRRVGGSSDPRALHSIDRHFNESCLVTCALALSLVLAGSGDLDAFRLLRSLRARLETRNSPAVAHQQALHLALGLLFLGGGEATLDSSVPSVAMLLIALCPIYSSSIKASDQRYFLQPLRHLYALAVRTRAVQAIDIETGEPCHCQFQVEYRVSAEEEMQQAPEVRQPILTTTVQTELQPKPAPLWRLKKMTLTAPCLLPPRAVSLRVNDSLHWSYSIPLDERDTCDRAVQIFVKRRRGELLQDVEAQQWLSALQAFVKHDESFLSGVDLSLTAAASSSRNGQSIASYDWAVDRELITVMECMLREAEKTDLSIVQRWFLWLYECVRDEKMEVFASCLVLDAQLHKAKQRVEIGGSTFQQQQQQQLLLDADSARSFELLMAFYERARDELCRALCESASTSFSSPSNAPEAGDSPSSAPLSSLTPILSAQFVVNCRTHLNQTIDSSLLALELDAALRAASTNALVQISNPLAHFLAVHSMPHCSRLVEGVNGVKEVLEQYFMHATSAKERGKLILPLLAAFFPDCHLKALQLLEKTLEL